MHDDRERIELMDPMFPDEHPRLAELEDLAIDLVAKASGLAGRLHPIVRDSVAELVRFTDCYYSTLIEGHDTRPVDIERALRKDYSANRKKRSLQLEASAYIAVRQDIDSGAFDAAPWRTRTIAALHEGFCRRLPQDMLRTEFLPDGKIVETVRVVPGAWRERDVTVGGHITVSPGAVPRFLARFEEAYRPDRLSRLRRIIAIPAAHHRLLWIHPFTDDNGRVARLLAHAQLREAGVGTSLWSLARGLARRATEYKALLIAADQPRRDDRDGRGSRTLAGLIDFCAFFLETCTEEVVFMEDLLDPARLLDRIEIAVGEETRAGRLPASSFAILRYAIMAGEVRRSAVPSIAGVKERQARNVTAALVDAGMLISKHHRAPLCIGFPAAAAERWFPNLMTP